jgi:hypothetical protein
VPVCWSSRQIYYLLSVISNMLHDNMVALMWREIYIS